MNEYYTIKRKQLLDRQEKESKRAGKSTSRSGRGYSSEYAKVSYTDPDMNQLATQNKGTTNAYSYS